MVSSLCKQETRRNIFISSSSCCSKRLRDTSFEELCCRAKGRRCPPRGFGFGAVMRRVHATRARVSCTRLWETVPIGGARRWAPSTQGFRPQQSWAHAAARASSSEDAPPRSRLRSTSRRAHRRARRELVGAATRSSGRVGAVVGESTSSIVPANLHSNLPNSVSCAPLQHLSFATLLCRVQPAGTGHYCPVCPIV